MTAVHDGVTRVARKTKQVYRIAFTYRGTQCRETIVLPHTKGNDTYCQRLRAEILGKIARNDFNYADHFPESPRAVEHSRGAARGVAKLKDALAAWIARSKATLEPSTWISYNNAVQHKLLPYFGNIKPAALRPADIREWVGLQTSSLKTIANVLLPLRAVLDELVEDEVIKLNPLRTIKLAKMVPAAKRVSDFECDPYTWDELARVLQALPAEKRPLFQFWAFTGLRTGELIGLRWSRVDLAAGTVYIQETTTMDLDKDRPKTKSGVRTIALLPAARQALDDMRAVTQLAGGRVFLNPTTRRESGAWSYNPLTASWRVANEQAGVRYRNPYQLRHTFASQLLSQGENPARIASVLGHKTIEMVIRTYGRWIGGQPASAHRWGERLFDVAADGGWQVAA